MHWTHFCGPPGTYDRKCTKNTLYRPTTSYRNWTKFETMLSQDNGMVHFCRTWYNLYTNEYDVCMFWTRMHRGRGAEIAKQENARHFRPSYSHVFQSHVFSRPWCTSGNASEIPKTGNNYGTVSKYNAISQYVISMGFSCKLKAVFNAQ